MKKTVLALLALAFIFSAFSCRKKGESPINEQLEAALTKDTTQIEFLDSVTYYFDTITEGDKVEHSFRIKNTGANNLIIARAFGSCGCTVPEYPKEPVKPGEIATIHVTFNSSGKSNDQKKDVTLVCNTPVRNEKLFLKGFVRAKE